MNWGLIETSQFPEWLVVEYYSSEWAFRHEVVLEVNKPLSFLRHQTLPSNVSKNDYKKPLSASAMSNIDSDF